ncbi:MULTISPECIES: putative T6SS immunity periplasmic lipoprotein [Serratia]|uniref:putative T6SS immunity periplasmic lipoprotein n=1 Tax=Serratia TaxID=613 RepID=UPI000B132457|nr:MULTISPECIES: putative T6SS immunity periplasmic lipoprotein [Serratia]MDH2270490.1 hypothetical protein [Serratia marcescens]MDH2278466.1 hypothetical protein [Serratia marcescens]QKO39789.1 hypothetical protein F0335_15195 [Serratia marcescens]
MEKRKYLATLCSILMLSACESRILDIQAAKVSVVDDKVCLQVPAKSHEYLNGIQIVEADKENEAFRKYFDVNESQPLLLSQDLCVPDFGYPFKEGHTYGFLTETFFKGEGQSGGRNFSSSFRLYRESGVLKVEQIR